MCPFLSHYHICLDYKYANMKHNGCVLFRWPGPARGRSRDVIDGPGPTGLARGKRTVTVIAYRLFHSPAKDLRYSAATNHINRQRSTLQ